MMEHWTKDRFEGIVIEDHEVVALHPSVVVVRFLNMTLGILLSSTIGSSGSDEGLRKSSATLISVYFAFFRLRHSRSVDIGLVFVQVLI